MKLFVSGQFGKLAFIPALTLRTWWWLWSITIVVMIVHWFGSYFWWPYSQDIGVASICSFIVLSATPLDFQHGRRVVYLVCAAGSEGPFSAVSRYHAWQLRRSEVFEVHRVVVVDGEVVHGKRIS